MMTKLKNTSKSRHQSKKETEVLAFFSSNPSASQDEIIDKFFVNLKNLKQYRSNLKQFNDLIDTQTKQYKPLARQVSEQLIKSHTQNVQVSNPSEQLLDIEYRTSSQTSATDGIKEIFKQFKFGFV
jgi:hypothetical protein